MPYAEEEYMDNGNDRVVRPLYERYYSRLHGGKVPDRIGVAAVLKELIQLNSVASRVHLAQYGGLNIDTGIIELVIQRPDGFDVPGFQYDSITKLAEIDESNVDIMRSIALRSLVGQRTDVEISY